MIGILTLICSTQDDDTGFAKVLDDKRLLSLTAEKSETTVGDVERVASRNVVLSDDWNSMKRSSRSAVRALSIKCRCD